MKRFYLIFAAILLTASLFAQAPEEISYQAVVRDAKDQLVRNTQIGMKISILQGTIDGAAVYTETRTPTTNSNGLVTVNVGGGKFTIGDFKTIIWSKGPYFIKTEIDPTGGTKYTITGTSKILSVPYALYAKSAESVANESQNLSQVLDRGNDAGNNRIINLASPLYDHDAATKKYVDRMDSLVRKYVNDMLLLGGAYTIKDYDGNIYRVVKIGNQVWMAENLRVTHFPDGTAIPLITDNSEWADLGDNDTDKAYCYYDNSRDSLAKYGALYTYAAALEACPEGWHLPSDTEWRELKDYVTNDDHSGTEGDALKSTTGWLNNGNGTDNYGFSALPGGMRNFEAGYFTSVGLKGYWWSNSYTSIYSIGFSLYYNYSTIYMPTIKMSSGASVRCIKD